MAKSRRKVHADLPSEVQSVPQPETLGAPQAAGDTTAAAPDRDRIATRAYELYEARGGSHGLALDDWLAAERELLNPSTPRSSE